MTKGLMIAAPRSGSGKTTVILGLLRALTRRNHVVSSFKCGPDYIDPAFHRVATGQQSYNLDSWTMPEAVLNNNFALGAEGADIVVAEASMGLFDGVATKGASGDGASADIAARFGLPVILVMDVSGQSQSAGAIAMGFRDFRKDVTIAGVILGNVASERHRMLAQRGVESVGMRVFGALPRGGVPTIPERHLGLVQANEIPNVLKMVDDLADAMEKHLDVGAMILAAGEVWMPKHVSGSAIRPPAKNIALASDVAFSFIYPHILDAWKAAGCQISLFSPLADEAPDLAADMCWLSGGYPELYAELLSGNQNFIQGLRAFAQHKPVHGECGGYMVLGESLVCADGKSWPMAGLLPLNTSFAQRKLHLGYRAVELLADSPIGKKGELVRGHEFHYSHITELGASQALGNATDANGKSLGNVGQKVGNVTGSFFHAVAA